MAKRGPLEIESLENELGDLDGLIEQAQRDLAKIEAELDQVIDPEDYEAVVRLTEKQHRCKKVACELRNLVNQRERISRQLDRLSIYA